MRPIWPMRRAPGRQLQFMAAVVVLLFVAILPVAGQSTPDLAVLVREAVSDIPDPMLEMPNESDPVGTVRSNGVAVARFGSSWRVAGTVGYSGHPVDVLVVVGSDGIVRKSVLLRQEEPILTLGIDPAALTRFVEAFAGVDVRMPVRELQQDSRLPDGVSGATVSSGVIRDAVLRTGRLLLAAPDRSAARQGESADRTWSALVSDGTVRILSVSLADARAAMPGVAKIPDGDGAYVEIAVARIDDNTAATLVGNEEYTRAATAFAADDPVFLIAARGVFSIKGTAWRRSGVFERLEFSTDAGAYQPTADRHVRLERIAAPGAPEFREIMLLALPALAGTPRSMTLTVDKTGEGASAPARFTLDLAAVPAATVPADDEPLWLEQWRVSVPQVAALTAMLAVLFAALYVSGPIVRRPKLYAWFRAGFLSVTLIWLGWIAGAQLSIVQVVAFLQSLLTGFRWEVFLLAPLIFMLWSFVALGVLFWGRGVYCGWLCPFGALQELLYKAGQRLGVTRIDIPWEIHERLWPIKYVAFLVIIGLSLNESSASFAAAEIEPFKTAVIMHFMRDWPYVVYALSLLAAGLFVERAYCRYLCPLGAALALPSKFKIFDWLIRRPQCGRECRLCATTCTVQAIDPIGRINPNECIYCLKCQVNYHDPQTCVPLKMRAHRRGEGQPTAGTGQSRPQLVRRDSDGPDPAESAP